jgi:phage terminase large subunit GpA-like protein
VIQLEQAFYRALAPPPHLTVSQWADEYRVLSSEASAEPGRWRTDRAPYQRDMMDALHDPTVHTIVVMSSSQVGKSEVLLNILGYCIDMDPGPVLMVQPTLEMAEAFSKDRIDTMLRDTPVLRDKVSDAKRDGSNTIRHKTFPGGHITLAGSNSPASLASRPIRWLLADEIDRFDSGLEGDPLALAEKRTTTFWNKKHVEVSTPTIKGLSRVEAKYGESDQRRCFVACPHCGFRHVLEWKHVEWTSGDASTAHFTCPDCGSEIDEAARQEMLRDPEWRPTAPFTGTAGFHIWEAYSPWRRLSDIVADFLEAKKAPDTLQVFVNTSLGETWEQQEGDQVQPDTLLARREPYPSDVPAGAGCLTMGVDVQDDRLEALVLGWGPGEECWIVEHRAIPGDPQRPEPWKALDEILNGTYTHESGALLQVMATCVDTAGHRTQYAYDYVAPRQHQRVYAIIGRDGSDRPIVSAPSHKRSGRELRKVDLYTVGTDLCKALIQSRLKVTEKGPGYVHLPLAHQVGQQFRYGVDEEFIAQLTAEKLVTKFKSGFGSKVWVKTRARNEALDMTVYATAALRLLRPNLDEMAARLSPNRVKPPSAPASTRPSKPAWIPKRRGSWLRGRG